MDSDEDIFMAGGYVSQALSHCGREYLAAQGHKEPQPSQELAQELAQLGKAAIAEVDVSERVSFFPIRPHLHHILSLLTNKYTITIIPQRLMRSLRVGECSVLYLNVFITRLARSTTHLVHSSRVTPVRNSPHDLQEMIEHELRTLRERRERLELELKGREEENWSSSQRRELGQLKTQEMELQEELKACR